MKVTVWKRVSDPGHLTPEGTGPTGDLQPSEPQPSDQPSPSLVLSDIIKHFNPSVLRPVCTPGRKVIPHIGAE